MNKHQEFIFRTDNPPLKRSKLSQPSSIIGFSDDDLSDVQLPHSDALVITTHINGWDVKRILVDTGSSAEILYADTFIKMGLPRTEIKPLQTPLLGFSSVPVWPWGSITLPIRTGTRTTSVEFLVVDAPSPYQVILGRTWLHEMGAITSTLHQKLRFHNGIRVETIRGDQTDARRCALISVVPEISTIVTPTNTPKEPTPLPEPDRFPKEKVVEELKQIQIQGEGTERFFLIGTLLPEQEQTELLQLLQDNKDNFAWTPQEMPGLDPALACHRLNVDVIAKPVIQRNRRIASDHSQAVMDEVDRLLAAGAIQEVFYPEWLANTVVVQKKNGKWRVCVDYTDLNKACPKDPYPLPKIDQLVDATSGAERMSFLDAYNGYHHIPLHEDDREKNIFHYPSG